MAQQSRGVWTRLFRGFLDSFRPRQIRGNLIGKDYMGNTYYEIPANPEIGRRNANRWFEPTVKNKFDQEVPAEWEAWLRGRRKQAPTEEEVLKNVALMQMKKENAKKIDNKWSKLKEEDDASSFPPIEEKPAFPKYDEYDPAPKNAK